jgi:hypothetical protein
MGTAGTLGSFDATKADSITGSAYGEPSADIAQKNFDINRIQSIGHTPGDSSVRA